MDQERGKALHYYNWKKHYDVQLRELENTGAFSHYRIQEETGEGKVTSCTVFPGIQAVYNDLNLFRCGRTVPRNEEIVEINYCLDGQYECEVHSQYFFMPEQKIFRSGMSDEGRQPAVFRPGIFQG